MGISNFGTATPDRHSWYFQYDNAPSDVAQIFPSLQPPQLEQPQQSPLAQAIRSGRRLIDNGANFLQPPYGSGQ